MTRNAGDAQADNVGSSHGARCVCERCKRVVERPTGSWFYKAVYAGSWLLLAPYIAMCAVTGLGIFAFVPMAVALGLSLSAVLGPRAFPRALCPECGASLPEKQRASREASGVASSLEWSSTVRS
ncbi:MAG: hypothetical protein U0271_20520 [Polyangiaceae bacterium]